MLKFLFLSFFSDVTIGSLLGLSVAYCCYRQAYPAFSCCTSHLPYFCSHSSDDTNHDNRISNLSRPSSTPVILTSAQKFSEDSFKYVWFTWFKISFIGCLHIFIHAHTTLHLSACVKCIVIHQYWE